VKVFLVIARILGIKGGPVWICALAICGLTLIGFTALGYFGGELVLGATDLNKLEMNKENQVNPEHFKKILQRMPSGRRQQI